MRAIQGVRLRGLSVFAAAMFGCLAVFGAISSPPAGAVDVQAHRGGANADGVAAYPENSMCAFSHSLSQGWVIELDVASTADGVAVVMHDDKVDRTTDCEGKINGQTWEELSSCRLDVIGIGSAAEGLSADDPRREPIPRLSEVLDLLKQTGGRANIEVKDITNGFSEAVYEQIAASGVPTKKVIIQNFAKPGLDPVASMLPGAGIALLTLNGSETYFKTGQQVKATWMSPNWSETDNQGQYVAHAHAQGFKVVPWTVDKEADLLSVKAAGADAVISNDPTLAQRLIGPSNAAKPRLRLRVARSGGVRVRPGAAKLFTVTVANTGRVISGPVRLSLKLPRRLMQVKGGATRSLAAIPAESTQTVKFRIKIRPRAKSKKKVGLTFTARDLTAPAGERVRGKTKLKIVPRARKR